MHFYYFIYLTVTILWLWIMITMTMTMTMTWDYSYDSLWPASHLYGRYFPNKETRVLCPRSNSYIGALVHWTYSLNTNKPTNKSISNILMEAVMMPWNLWACSQCMICLQIFHFLLNNVNNHLCQHNCFFFFFESSNQRKKEKPEQSSRKV